jgi:hypothetical protein
MLECLLCGPRKVNSLRNECRNGEVPWNIRKRLKIELEYRFALMLLEVDLNRGLVVRIHRTLREELNAVATIWREHSVAIAFPCSYDILHDRTISWRYHESTLLLILSSQVTHYASKHEVIEPISHRFIVAHIVFKRSARHIT